MMRALAWKEIREMWWVFAVAAVLFGTAFYDYMGMEFHPRTMSIRFDSRDRIPFQVPEQFEIAIIGFGFSDDFTSTSLVPIGALIAVAVGFWQTLRESSRGTWHYLLGRPPTRGRLTRAKLVIGLFIVMITTVIPLLVYGGWASTPGTHASPFEWSMTGHAWLAWAALPIFYFGAFLSGLRPGRWYGTRLLPLAGAFLAFACGYQGIQPNFPAGLLWLAWTLIAAVFVADLLFLLSIVSVSRTRDFS